MEAMRSGGMFVAFATLTGDTEEEENVLESDDGDTAEGARVHANLVGRCIRGWRRQINSELRDVTRRIGKHLVSEKKLRYVVEKRKF
jgi:hypothetical protein